MYFISDSASRPFASPLFACFCQEGALLDFIRFSVCFEVKYLFFSSTHRAGGKWSVLNNASDKGFEYKIRIDSSQTTEKQQLSKVFKRNVFPQGRACFRRLLSTCRLSRFYQPQLIIGAISNPIQPTSQSHSKDLSLNVAFARICASETSGLRAESGASMRTEKEGII